MFYRHKLRIREQRQGVAAVELVVLLPFLAFVLITTIDFARIMYYVIVIDNSSHNAAIFGSQVFDNQNQQWIAGQTQYWQSASGQMVSTQQSAADIDGANLSPPLAYSNVSVDSTQKDSSGNPINIVTITYTFNTITSYPGVPSSITIKRVYQARVAPASPG
jgi:Flp pilus assembly protein TadG